jgi:glycosyltransferase involved in cell wall biosynthesis
MIEPIQTAVVIPAYNEAPAIGPVLVELCALGYRVIVVDDGSVDNTQEVALQYPVTLLHHATNLGQGAALQTGITFALQDSSIQTIITFDSDGQHNPAAIADLLAALEGGFDVALGSRFMPGGQAQNIPWLKKMTLRLAIQITRRMTGLHLTDTHNGLRAFRRSAAAKIRIRQNGMAHASEILSEVALLDLRYCEVPVDIHYTAYSLHKGQSILNGVNILWDILGGKIR